MVVNINKVVLKANDNAKNGGPSLHGGLVQRFLAYSTTTWCQSPMILQYSLVCDKFGKVGSNNCVIYLIAMCRNGLINGFISV